MERRSYVQDTTNSSLLSFQSTLVTMASKGPPEPVDSDNLSPDFGTASTSTRLMNRTLPLSMRRTGSSGRLTVMLGILRFASTVMDIAGTESVTAIAIEGAPLKSIALVETCQGWPALIDRRSTEAGVEQRAELRGTHGVLEVVPLSFMTSGGDQKIDLLRCLHAFGDDPLVQALAHADDGADDHGAVSVP